MQHTYFVPRNTIKLTTRGGTSPDGVEMTLIGEEIYTPSGDEATACLGLLYITTFLYYSDFDYNSVIT